MRPAAATIWKYLLEREQSPEGAPLFMKFYVGCWERNRERERRGKKKRKEKVGEKEKGNNRNWKNGGGGKNLERQRLEERSGWSRKRKDAGWKRTEGKEACKVAFRLSREKHRPRRIGVNGVSSLREFNWADICLGSLISCPPVIFIMDTWKFGRYGEVVNWNYFFLLEIDVSSMIGLI